MITEQDIKAALDGLFYCLDHRDNSIVLKRVEKDHIPDHKPRWTEEALETLRTSIACLEWDDEIDEFIVNKRAAGTTFGAISRELNISETAIWKRYKFICEERGIDPAPRVAPRRRSYSAELEAEVVRYRHEDKSFSEIALMLGIRKHQAYEIYRMFIGRKRKRAA